MYELIPFYITWDHLKNGICHDPYKCALVTALKDAIPNSTVRIDGKFSGCHMVITNKLDEIHYEKVVIRLTLSKTVQYWILAFDRKIGLAPTVMFFLRGTKETAKLLARIDIENDENLLNKVNWKEVNDKERELLRPTQAPESGTPGRETDAGNK